MYILHIIKRNSRRHMGPLLIGVIRHMLCQIIFTVFHEDIEKF